MTLEEQMNDILFEIEKGKLFAIAPDTTDLFKQAIKKLLAYDLISKRGNTFDLTKNGHEAIELGGFNAWKSQIQNTETIKSLTINGDVKGSQVALSSRLGNLESKNFSIKSVNEEAIVNPTEDPNTTQKKLSIFEKIYKWTDHKLVSNIIFGILSFLAAIIANYLGWIPCLNK